MREKDIAPMGDAKKRNKNEWFNEKEDNALWKLK